MKRLFDGDNSILFTMDVWFLIAHIQTRDRYWKTESSLVKELYFFKKVDIVVNNVECEI